MPQVLVPVIQGIGAVIGGAGATALGVGIVTYAGAIATGLALVGTLALSAYQKRKQERAARAQFDASQVDRMTNLPLTVAPRELVLGRVRKGGVPFFRSSWGPYQDTFVMTIALAGHEIDEVEQVYFNDLPISTDGSGNVTTAPYARDTRYSATENMQTTSLALAHTPIPDTVTVLATDSAAGINGGTPFRPEFTLAGNTVTIASIEPGWNYTVSYQWINTSYYARVFVRYGSPSQAADERLKGYFPGVWTDAHQARGVAYLLCEFVYDETAFPSGIPNVTARFRGAKMYDPRTGTTYWNENPALMMRHIMTHPQFGKRTSISAGEETRIIAAANDCDTAFSYDGNNTVALYRAGCVFPFGSAARDALDDLAQAMGGEWAYASGEFYMRAGVYRAPVAALGDADLAVVQRASGGGISQSSITISPHRARNEKFNTVLARIWNEAAGYVQTPISPMRISSYVTADGAELAQEVTMPAVFYAYQAYHVAGIMLRDSRDPLTVKLPFKLSAYAIELFDTVTLTLSRYGWSAKEFRVLGRTFMPDGFIELTLQETAAAIFQWSAGYEPGGFADNSGLPTPWNIHPPAITSITSGESELVVQSDGTVVNGVRVMWTPPQDASIRDGGTIEVQTIRVGIDSAWKVTTVPGGDTQAVILGYADLAYIAVRVRSRNSLAVSDWSLQIYHTVVGKTEPPPNIENLTIAGSVLSWSLPRRVPDLAGFVFRFHYGNNLDWNSATPLHDGIITEIPWEPERRPGGVVSIMGKAIDTSGNLSQASGNIVMNLGDPTIANIVEQWDFDALGWPFESGSQSGWTLVSGNPTADALDSFYGTDDQSFYGADTDSFYEAGAYGQMVYVTEPISVSSALAGSIMTLLIDVQGIDLKVEYRLAGPTPFYGADGDSFYGADADSFYEPPGDWLPWPGQIIADRDVYQFRVTIGAGAVQGILQSMVLTIDAPDLEESLADLPILAAGTTIPYTKAFTSIKTVQATLQANGSGAETVEIDKTVALAPSIKAYNSAHTAVSGATADIVLRGY